MSLYFFTSDKLNQLRFSNVSRHMLVVLLVEMASANIFIRSGCRQRKPTTTEERVVNLRRFVCPRTLKRWRLSVVA